MSEKLDRKISLEKFKFMADLLAKKIIATVAYHDVLDYPLTVFELWKYLIENTEITIDDQVKKPLMLIDIINALEDVELKKRIKTDAGYYFFDGREHLVSQRVERNKISEDKYKIIRRVVGFLRFVPFVRMILITGRVAMKNAEKKSDLDLLLVFEKGHIFSGRFLTVILLSLLGKKRTERKIKNKICLNHFLSTDLSTEVQDLFSAHEYVFMSPIFGAQLYAKFFKKNAWIKKYQPNFEGSVLFVREIKDNKFSKSIRQFLEYLFSFDFIENSLKKFQLAKIMANPKTQKAGGVIIHSDNELAFWPDFEKQGPRVFEEFKKRCLK